MASHCWRSALWAVLAAVLAMPVVLSVLVLVHELHARGPAGHYAVVELVWVGLAVAAAAGVLWTVFVSRGEMHRRGQVMDAAASTSRDWLWESDVHDRLTYSNQAVGDLLGYQPAALLGASVFDLLADEANRGRALAMRDQSRQAASGWDDIELEWRHRDGSTVALQGSAAPIRDRAGQIVGFRGTRRLVSDDRHPRAVVLAARQRIAQLLTTGSLDVALQPIVDLASGRVAGVEALARFGDGRSPDVWFGDAYVAGRTRELEEYAVNAALPLLRDIPASVYLSVNASPSLLMHVPFGERLIGSGLALGRLVIEITEHDRVADYDRLNAALAPLRERGVRFAIDDTGAGYASLSHVLRLHPDMIKLDRDLITNLDDDRARRSLVTALVLLALDVGAAVTGEGVETATQLETLATLGVDQVQGYLLAPPSTARKQWQAWWPRHWSTGCPAENASACDEAALFRSATQPPDTSPASSGSESRQRPRAWTDTLP
jgi:PAS domain S-box-containing protein